MGIKNISIQLIYLSQNLKYSVWKVCTSIEKFSSQFLGWKIPISLNLFRVGSFRCVRSKFLRSCVHVFRIETKYDKNQQKQEPLGIIRIRHHLVVASTRSSSPTHLVVKTFVGITSFHFQEGMVCRLMLPPPPFQKIVL